jgi:cellulose synthase (UDP-forming)
LYALDIYIASLGPAFLVVGLAVFIGLSSPQQPILRIFAIIVAVALSWRYMLWRISDTIPEFDDSVPDAIAGWTFAALEALTLVSATLAMFILSRTRDRTPEASVHLNWWKPQPAPRIEVLIATYNEEETILERTIAGALVSDYPNFRVWVLDDGRRVWLRALCARLGAHYVVRSDNAHAKAGNINNALAMLRQEPVPPVFIAVLDADFVPHRDFLSRTLALFHDQTVGLVQTPQHFFNPDPIQHNLGIRQGYPDEQRFFFDDAQPARDAWSIAFCCGTSSMMRWRAIEAIGGFPTESVTEDFLITLRLREEGWSTVYLNEPLTEGLAPEGLGEYITQRGRWCLGLMQIVRGRLGPLRTNRLRLIDRLGLIDAFLYWSTTYPFRIICLITPMLYWFFGVTVVNAEIADVLYYFIPYYILSLFVLNWISRGKVMPLFIEVSQLLGATAITKAVFQGLANPHNQKFKVTAKGGDRTRVVVQWPILWPILLLFVLNYFGLLFSGLTDIVFDRDPGEGRAIIVTWSLYNLVVLNIAALVCIEPPRAQLATSFTAEIVRISAGREIIQAWVIRLTTEEAWIRGAAFLTPGREVYIDIEAVGCLLAIVKCSNVSGLELNLQPSPAQRAAILRKLHTRVGAAGTQRASPTMLVIGALRRALGYD